MNFLNVLLRAVGFIPSLVAGIEGMCKSKSGAEKKDAAMMFLESALSTMDASRRARSSTRRSFVREYPL